MSEVSHRHDTWIAAVPFPDGTDRRQSARVPCALRVRLGPPKAPPQTTLLAEDLSTGGVFVRCAEPVQVGARFSIELALASGETVYVPDAEVLYNVQSDTRRGFGARFVSVSREAMQRLVTAASFESDITPPKLREVSASMILEATSEIPQARLKHTVAIDVRGAMPMPRVSDLSLASIRPVKIGDRAFTAVLPVREGEEVHGASAYEDEDEDVPTPEPLADTLVPMSTEPVEAQHLDDEDGFDAEDMHDGIDWQPREVRARANSPLRRFARRVRSRPLVFAAACASCAMIIVAGVSLVRRGDEALASRPAPPRISNATHRALTSPLPAAPAVVPAPAPEPAPAPAVAVKAPAGKAEPVRAEPPKKPLPELVSVAPVKSRAVEPPPSVVLGVAPGTKVLRTYVFKNPDRFVVDLVGQPQLPSIVSRAPGVPEPRIGKHPEYLRVVIDSTASIERGSVEKRGERLEIRLVRR